MSKLSGVFSAVVAISVVFLQGCSSGKAAEAWKISDGVHIHTAYTDKVSADIDCDLSAGDQDAYEYGAQIVPYEWNPEKTGQISELIFGSKIDLQTDQKMEDETGYPAYIYDQGDSNGVTYYCQGQGCVLTVSRPYGYSYYYRAENSSPFWGENLDDYYDHSDLPFMKVQEAEKLCEEILDAAGYPWDVCEEWTISRDGMRQYEEHNKLFKEIYSNVPDTALGSEKSEGFYVLYYPLRPDGLTVSDVTEASQFLYCSFLIDRDGIFEMSLNTPIRITDKNPVEITAPGPLVDELAAYYENILTDGSAVMDGISLAYDYIGMDAGKKYYDYTTYYGPEWKIHVTMQQDGEEMEDVISYNACTGERMDG